VTVEVLLKAIVLGIVEGVTEFLPISSTGHLLVVSNLLRFEGSAGGTFEIFIQFGAVVALLLYYARDLLGQAADAARGGTARRFWLCVLVAFLPAAVLGLLLRNVIKTILFASPTLIALSLIVGGIVFLVVERTPRREDTRAVEDVSLAQALAIGFAQVLSLVPGVSRSGASIVGGMLTGLDRATATRFSFYLAIPTLGAATLFELASSLRRLNSGDAMLLLVGTIVAGVVAFASIGWLLRYVQRNSFVPFGIYRIAAGIVVLALVQMGVL
jgi:undecaprenyl-diphosphatase